MIYHVYDVVTISMLLIKLSMALLKIAFLVLRFMSINLPMTSSRNVLECCSENFTFDSETITAGD